MDSCLWKIQEWLFMGVEPCDPRILFRTLFGSAMNWDPSKNWDLISTGSSLIWRMSQQGLQGKLRITVSDQKTWLLVAPCWGVITLCKSHGCGFRNSPPKKNAWTVTKNTFSGYQSFHRTLLYFVGALWMTKKNAALQRPNILHLAPQIKANAHWRQHNGRWKKNQPLVCQAEWGYRDLLEMGKADHMIWGRYLIKLLGLEKQRTGKKYINK